MSDAFCPSCRTYSPRPVSTDAGRQNAPAKINLTLDILGRRPDGYHDLRMVMQTISLADVVTLEEQRENRFTFSTNGDFFPVSGNRKTLEEQTAEAFFAAIGRPLPGLRVTLEKITPAYAGLGGGSADVAALLRLLRARYSPNLPISELERMGLRIGSDVPFCVQGGTALAEGRGERLHALPTLPDCPIVLCKPPFGIPTPSLFALADRKEIHRRPDTDGVITALEEGDLPGVAERLCNVFEDILPEEYEEVFLIKRRMRDLGAYNAVMSGSGPTVFGLFGDDQTAAEAVSVLRRTYRETFLARPVELSGDLE